MHKWPLFIVAGISSLGLSGLAIADSEAILPLQDTLGCTQLIQQGAMNPPVVNQPVSPSDLAHLKSCMNNCDELYGSYGERGREEDMMIGATFCRQSLNNLYFSSIAQTINDDLNQQTSKSKEADQQSMFEKLAATIKQQQQQQQQQNQATQNEQNTNDNYSASAPTPVSATPIGPSDNVKW